MPWVEKRVRNELGRMVANLSELHKAYGKEQNQQAFSSIADVCDKLLMLLAQEKTVDPEDQIEKIAETTSVQLAGLLNIIETNLNQIVGFKRGRENFESFMRDFNATIRSKDQFSSTYQRNIREELDKQNAYKEIKKSNPTYGMQELIDTLQSSRQSFHAKPKPKVKLEDQEGHDSDIHIASDQELQILIGKLRICPVRAYSGGAFFNRTWNKAWSYHPKKMGTGTGLLTIGMSYAGLSTIQHYAGPILDRLIQEGINVAIDNEYVIAATLVLAGSALGGLTLARSAPSYGNANSGAVSSSKSTSSDLEQQSLLEHREEEPRRRYFGIC